MSPTSTRDRLVRGGLDLLVEGGWPRVTSRAVAEQADVNVGLIHYHFGGMPQLRLAITAAAVDLLVGQLHRDLLATTDLAAMVEVLVAQFDDDAGGSVVAAQVTAALLEGAAREPELAGVLRGALREARADLAARLAATHPDWSSSRISGVAALFVAATDGLLMHGSVDDELPRADAVAALGDLIGAGSPAPEVQR